MISRAELLTVIRSGSELAALARTSNDKLVLEAGIVPIALLKRHLIKRGPTELEPFDYEANWDWFLTHENSPFVELIDRRKLLRSQDYIRDNPHERQRLVDSQYDIKPLYNVWPGNTYRTTYSVKGRNRHALWDIHANSDRSGSKGESRGLQAVLEFFRLPHIQRAWRRHIDDPKFRLSEKAK